MGNTNKGRRCESGFWALGAAAGWKAAGEFSVFGAEVVFAGVFFAGAAFFAVFLAEAVFDGARALVPVVFLADAAFDGVFALALAVFLTGAVFDRVVVFFAAAFFTGFTRVAEDFDVFPADFTVFLVISPP